MTHVGYLISTKTSLEDVFELNGLRHALLIQEKVAFIVKHQEKKTR